MKQVIHLPFGHEHPYEQRPEERFPRHSLAGEPFTIGIVTRPPQAIESVTVHSEIDGVLQEVIDATALGGWRPELEQGVGAEYLERLERVEQDVWQAELVAPEFGQVLTYWIEADGIQTDKFTIVGETWQSAADSRLSVDITNVVDSDDHPQVIAIEYLSNGQHDYLFGRDLLVSPVVEQDAETWTTYLPDGHWRSFWTDAVLEGGKNVTSPVPLDRISIFIRDGSQLKSMDS